jgi:hypothetical protein
VEGLGSPMIGPASSLFPFPVQVLPIGGPCASARLVVCRGDQQRTMDHLRSFPAPADTAQGRGKERSIRL